jgi:hypothetical protein
MTRTARERSCELYRAAGKNISEEVSNPQVFAHRWQAGPVLVDETKETLMPTQKYLLIQRSAPGKKEPPSPAQMQEMYAVFSAWKEKFKANIVDMGGKLKPGGKIASAAGVTDGPFIEAKEIIGGYMVVEAESYEQVLQIAKEGPGMVMPGSSVEIREIAFP